MVNAIIPEPHITKPRVQNAALWLIGGVARLRPACGFSCCAHSPVHKLQFEQRHSFMIKSNAKQVLSSRWELQFGRH